MWTQTAAALLVCGLWMTQARSIWDDPIKFNTKANDTCTMTITGQREYTRLRLSCQSSKRSYWCEYRGKPHICRAYNKNPRHFFVQMMWILRKLPNACLAPTNIKPHMCRKEPTDDSQMVFIAASFVRSDVSSNSTQRPVGQSATPQPETPQPAPQTPDSARQAAMRTTHGADAGPILPSVESYAKNMSQQYCWRSMQGICTLIIGWLPK